MRTMQRISGLKSDDFVPAEFAKIGAQLIWRIAPTAKVIMHRRLDADHRATEVHRSGLVMQIVHARVGAVIGAENLRRLLLFVGGPIVGDRHCGEDDALLVAQRDVLTKSQALGELFRHIQCDRHWPQVAIGQPHISEHRPVICLT